MIFPKEDDCHTFEILGVEAGGNVDVDDEILVETNLLRNVGDDRTVHEHVRRVEVLDAEFTNNSIRTDGQQEQKRESTDLGYLTPVKVRFNPPLGFEPPISRFLPTN